MFTATIIVYGDATLGQIYGAFVLPRRAILSGAQICAQKVPAGAALSFALVDEEAAPLAGCAPIILARDTGYQAAPLAFPVLLEVGAVVRALCLGTGAGSTPGGFATITLHFETSL